MSNDIKAGMRARVTVEGDVTVGVINGRLRIGVPGAGDFAWVNADKVEVLPKPKRVLSEDDVVHYEDEPVVEEPPRGAAVVDVDGDVWQHDKHNDDGPYLWYQTADDDGLGWTELLDTYGPLRVVHLP